MDEENIKIEWKPVYLNGDKTRYEISEYGTVRNTETGHILVPVPLKKSGRLHVLIYHNGSRNDMRIHRLVYEAFNGPIPKDMTVDHIDENIYNNHYTNLRLLTASENIKSYLKNHPDHAKKYSDDLIISYFKRLQKGKYYKYAAKECGIDLEYALSLMNGRRRIELWKLYQPFPYSAHRNSMISKSDESALISLLIDGYSTKECLKILDISYCDKTIWKVQRLRRKLGIRDPKFFSEEMCQDVDKLILDGKSNKEIYDIMDLEVNERNIFFLVRHRKKLGIPNNNFTKGNKEETKLIRKMISEGYSNNDILKTIGKERNQYYINLFGFERQAFKKHRDCISSTIEKAPNGVTE